jgi:hypothetical protein
MTTTAASKGFSRPERLLALTVVTAATAALVAALVLLVVRPWHDSPPDLDAFVESLGDRVAVRSVGPSSLKNVIGAQRGETVYTDGASLDVFELPAGVEPPLGAYLQGPEVVLRWRDGPQTTVSTAGPVFLLVKRQLVVVTADMGLATAAREILDLPKSELIGSFTSELDWARPFARELQQQGHLVTSIAGAHPFVSSESALIFTERGEVALERLPEGIEAAQARIETRGPDGYALVIPGMADTEFGGGQAPIVRISGKGRLLAVTFDIRLAEVSAQALANTSP